MILFMIDCLINYKSPGFEACARYSTPDPGKFSPNTSTLTPPQEEFVDHIFFTILLATSQEKFHICDQSRVR